MLLEYLILKTKIEHRSTKYNFEIVDSDAFQRVYGISKIFTFAII